MIYLSGLAGVLSRQFADLPSATMYSDWLRGREGRGNPSGAHFAAVRTPRDVRLLRRITDNGCCVGAFGSQTLLGPRRDTRSG